MHSAAESNGPRPATEGHQGERSIHDMTSDQMMKPEVGVRVEAQLGTANDAVSTIDGELEARLKCIEQLKSQYGVSSLQRFRVAAISPNLDAALKL